MIKETESKDKNDEVSGYAIYSNIQKQRIVVNNLPEFYPELPDGKFDIIYCDPPWDYGGKMQFDKSCIKSENKDWKRDIFISAANFKYPTVKTKELKKMFPTQKKIELFAREKHEGWTVWGLDVLSLSD